LIDSLRAQIYEDYGGLDVHTIAAGATNDHIDAAYQPMDEEADDFEYQVIKAVRGILSIIGIDDMPIFKRNRISNSKEQVEMVMLTANYLDRETVLKKLPFLTVDEVENVLKNADAENESRFSLEEEQEEENGDELNE
ncbi:MAG: phage portal protein, partial [Clostridia bacterium]|nr:phage portal protein [Clostridia bacterium]